MMQKGCPSDPNQLVQFGPSDMFWIVELSFPQSCQGDRVRGALEIGHEKVLSEVELVAFEPCWNVPELGSWVVGIFCTDRQGWDDFRVLVEVYPEIVRMFTAPSMKVMGISEARIEFSVNVRRILRDGSVLGVLRSP